VFYFVGRLHNRRGVDCLNWMLPLLTGCWLMSWFTTQAALSVSFSASSIESQWTSQTYMVLGVMGMGVLLGVQSHVYFMFTDGLLGERVVAAGLGFGIAFGAKVSAGFHAHHWWLALVGGMHVNLRYSWSFGLQALLFGFYLNGLAVWGRDQVLGCEQAEFESKQQGCYWSWYD